MRVQYLKDAMYGSKVMTVGEKLDVPDHIARHLVKVGIAQVVSGTATHKTKPSK